MSANALPRSIPVTASMTTARAVVEAVTYADFFDYPLTPAEILRFLPAPAARHLLDETLTTLVRDGDVLESDGEYVFLPGRKALPGIRRERAEHAARAWRRARRYGKVLWVLPCVRMVAVTGALAMRNGGPNDDIDFLLVTEPDRLWTARALVVLVCRIARFFGDTLCPNYLVSTRALRLGDPNLYSAHELIQMVPLHGRQVVLRLREENEWYADLLPNAGPVSLDAVSDRLLPGLRTAKRVGEVLLRLPPGNRLERWERERKIAKLSAQAGENGGEVLYSVDVCKGHNRGHGRRIMEHVLGL